MAELALAVLGVVISATTAAHAIKHWSNSSRPDGLAEAEKQLKRYNTLISNKKKLEEISVENEAGVLSKLKLLVRQQKALEEKAAEPRTQVTKDDRDSLDKGAEQLLQEIRKFQKDNVPKTWFSWLGREPRLPEGDCQLPPSQERRRFCDGAILYQQGKTTIEKLTNKSLKAQQGFICTHCSLEVGDYGSFRVSKKKVLASQDLLPASHLAACTSLWERKAFYRCVVCYRQGAEVDFSCASDLTLHMALHPDGALVMNEENGSDALERDINALLLNKNQDSSADLSHQQPPETSTDGGKKHNDWSPTPSPDQREERHRVTVTLSTPPTSPTSPPPPSPPTPKVMTLSPRPRGTLNSNEDARIGRSHQQPPEASADIGKNHTDWSPTPSLYQRRELRGVLSTPPTPELMASSITPKETTAAFIHELETKPRGPDPTLDMSELPAEPAVGPISHVARVVNETIWYEATTENPSDSHPAYAPTRPPPPPPDGLRSDPKALQNVQEAPPVRPRHAQPPHQPGLDIAAHGQRGYVNPFEEPENQTSRTSRWQPTTGAEDRRYRMVSNSVPRRRPVGDRVGD
ncbi:hypothetical protein B0T10DRAFT_500015 [Thelonectria olida]|uniref:C2H2-type domain-containing protein n=1 Tax=Thelonectria olida TaxID=1576542 RepID=A0A9P9AIT5_9HYPO|nr:hypothetical protein B0T10DRAFT_500015 [Thelonectria olida]